MASRLDAAWRANLGREFALNASLADALRSVGLLHAAGVEILAGTDATAATRRTADRFGLTDRGRIEPGASADLLLVDGDPTTQLSATLNTRVVWRRGHRLTPGGATAADAV